MELTLPYSEISEYLKREFGVKIALDKSGENRLCVTYTKKVLVSVDIKICVTIDKVTPEPPQIALTYSGGCLVEPLIPAALAYLYAKNPSTKAVIQKGAGHSVYINLSYIPKSAPVWEDLTIESLRLSDTALTIIFTAK